MMNPSRNILPTISGTSDGREDFQKTLCLHGLRMNGFWFDATGDE